MSNRRRFEIERSGFWGIVVHMAGLGEDLAVVISRFLDQTLSVFNRNPWSYAEMAGIFFLIVYYSKKPSSVLWRIVVGLIVAVLLTYATVLTVLVMMAK